MDRQKRAKTAAAAAVAGAGAAGAEAAAGADQRVDTAEDQRRYESAVHQERAACLAVLSVERHGPALPLKAL
uniref:Uncharacterized protein n=1 Tax=Knipowitschia caucasica TaxID=637954 RepID=A0AAV2M7C2_KNICA